jgi:hypothetical protein
MKRTKKGYAPAKGFLAEQLTSLSLFAAPELPNVTIHEYEPLSMTRNFSKPCTRLPSAGCASSVSRSAWEGK